MSIKTFIFYNLVEVKPEKNLVISSKTFICHLRREDLIPHHETFQHKNVFLHAEDIIYWNRQNGATLQ